MDGLRKQVCGTWIGSAAMQRAGSGPWFVEATTTVRGPVVAHAGANGTWLRLTDDCAHGVTSHVTNGTVVRVTDRVRAKDGGDEAILVSPVRRGSSTVTASRDGRDLSHVRFAISNTLGASS